MSRTVARASLPGVIAPAFLLTTSLPLVALAGLSPWTAQAGFSSPSPAALQPAGQLSAPATVACGLSGDVALNDGQVTVGDVQAVANHWRSYSGGPGCRFAGWQV